LKCPNCQDEKNITVSRKDYIYPSLYFGKPTFWRFMSPAIASSVTVMIFIISIIISVLTIIWIIKGLWIPAISLIPGIILSIYSFIICLKSLGKYKIKEHFKCNSCRLEWSLGS
jgi:hypothetical protein